MSDLNVNMVPTDTKLDPRQARGSEPWPVMSVRDRAARYVPGGGEGRVCRGSGGGGSVLSGNGEPGRQAASAGVIVMVQPGLHFSSCRSR